MGTGEGWDIHVYLVAMMITVVMPSSHVSVFGSLIRLHSISIPDYIIHFASGGYARGTYIIFEEAPQINYSYFIVSRLLYSLAS